MSAMRPTFTNSKYLDRDLVNVVSIVLLFVATVMLLSGLLFSPPTTFNDFISSNYSEWVGLFADGILLWILNRIIRRQDKERIITQMASESNAFALDAIKQVERRGWLYDGTLSDRDLEHANLQGANLREADLSYCDFGNASMREARLFGANLSYANLIGVDLRHAELRSVNLRGANLRWANLENAILEGADLRDADLRFANLEGVRLDQVLTEGALIGAPLSPEEVDLVQDSFEFVMHEFDDFTKWFYFRLFHLAPEVKHLFLGSMRQQRKKFMQTVALLIQGLKDTQKVIPVLQVLGRRHVNYGVRDHHYEIVGQALLWALDKKLRQAFTPDVRHAWLKTYEMVTMVMRDAAR